jgi:hypothetical protein
VVLELDVGTARATFQLVPAAAVKTSYASRGKELRAMVRDVVLDITPGTITPG